MCVASGDSRTRTCSSRGGRDRDARTRDCRLRANRARRESASRPPARRRGTAGPPALPPPIETDLSRTTSCACSSALWMPSVTKVYVVRPTVRTAYGRLVTTKTGRSKADLSPQPSTTSYIRRPTTTAPAEEESSSMISRSIAALPQPSTQTVIRARHIAVQRHRDVHHHRHRAHCVRSVRSGQSVYPPTGGKSSLAVLRAADLPAMGPAMRGQRCHPRARAAAAARRPSSRPATKYSRSKNR